MTGIGSALAVFALLGLVGVAGPKSHPILLVVLQFLALVLGGYVAGRFARRVPAVEGGLAGLLMFFGIGAIGIAATGGPGAVEVVAGAVVSMVLGSAGGALAMTADDEGDLRP
ncbi:MAG TPA: hypothetical protein ENK55_02675 [Actinobacteria bacterium]|nr:hypothetical protein [Actinomycetota bacterium]